MCHDRIKEILICPKCKSELDFNNNVCPICSGNYENLNGKYIFNQINSSEDDDSISFIKNIFKKYEKLYYFLIYLISPVYSSRYLSKFLKEHVANKNTISVNLGSGNSKLYKDMINIDMFAYKNVDLVCDISNLPIKDNSVDIIFNIAVLEHVPYPEIVIDEIYRILKKDGIIFTLYPFIQGFHASPYDFNRKTIEGVKTLHKKFETVDLKVAGGPTSGFLWVLQEWLAMILSFGIKPLYIAIYLILMLITFPIKFIDIILAKHPMAKNIASSFVYVGKKQ